MSQAAGGTLPRCIFCNMAELEALASDLGAEDTQIDDLAKVKVVLSRLGQFSAMCLESPCQCADRDLVLFVGRSGAGKSTALNILCGKTPKVVKSSLGESAMHFDASKSVSIVAHGVRSGTRLPIVFTEKLAKFKGNPLLVDCPGFFENRSNGLELVQRCILSKILEERPAKVALFKSVLAERDNSFADILLSEIMVPGACMVVYTKASNDTEKSWKAAVDSHLVAKISSKFPTAHSLPCILLKRPDTNFLKDPRIMADKFTTDFSSTLSKLSLKQAAVMSIIPDSLGMLMHRSTMLYTQKIRTELSRRLTENMKDRVFQPYHSPPIKRILRMQNVYPNVIVSSFKEIGVLFVREGYDPLDEFTSYWEMFHSAGLIPKGVSCIDLIFPDVISKLDRIGSRPENQPKLDDASPLPDLLLEWVPIREQFFLEYVSYKGQILHLLERASLSPSGMRATHIAECKTLLTYRLGKCMNMEHLWCLIARKLQTDLAQYHEALKRIATIDGTQVEGATHSKTLVSTVETPDSTLNIETMIQAFQTVIKPDLIEKCIDIGLKMLKDDPTLLDRHWKTIGSGAAAIVAGAANAVADSTASLGGMGTGTLIGLSVLTAVGVGLVAYGGMQMYASYKDKSQFEEAGLIGLDFSQFASESRVWQSVREEIDTHGDYIDQYSINRLREVFKLYEEDFSSKVKSTQNTMAVRLDHITTLEHSEDELIAKWAKILTKNQQLARSIIGQLIGRAKSAAGCSYQEHSLISTYGMAVRIPSCCSNFLKGNLKQCKFCKLFFHDPDDGTDSTCGSKTRSILCVDNLNENASSNRSSNGVEVFFALSRSFTPQTRLSPSEIQISAKYCSAAYNIDENVLEQIKSSPKLKQSKASSKFEAIRLKNRKVLVTVTIHENLAYICFRGTEPRDMEKDWGFTPIMAPIRFDECSLHPGYLAICQEAMDEIFGLPCLTSCTNLIFSGHSLGGALAHTTHILYLLSHSFVSSANRRTYSVSFGASAAFGGAETEAFITKFNLQSRFVSWINVRDPVPLLIHFAASGNDLSQPYGVMTNEGALSGDKSDSHQPLPTKSHAFLIWKDTKSAGRERDSDEATVSGMAKKYMNAGTFSLFARGLSTDEFILQRELSLKEWLETSRLDMCNVDDHAVTAYEAAMKNWKSIEE